MAVHLRPIHPSELKAWWTAQNAEHGRRWFIATFLFNQARWLKHAITGRSTHPAEGIPVFRWSQKHGRNGDADLRLDGDIVVIIARVSHIKASKTGEWMCHVGEGARGFRAGRDLR